MVRYLGYLTSKTAMLFCVSHYWIRLLKQLYLLARDFNFRGARCFVWLTLFIAQGSRYISYNCCCHGVLFCCYCHACICYVGTYTHVHFYLFIFIYALVFDDLVCMDLPTCWPQFLGWTRWQTFVIHAHTSNFREGFPDKKSRCVLEPKNLNDSGQLHYIVWTNCTQQLVGNGNACVFLSICNCAHLISSNAF